MLEPLSLLAFALLFDDLDVLPFAVLPELGVGQQLVHQSLLPVLLGNPVRVEVHGRVNHVTNLMEGNKKNNEERTIKLSCDEKKQPMKKRTIK